MNFIADIRVMPKKELLDPQGKAVMNGLHNLGYAGMDNVRVGKSIQIEIQAASETEARQWVEESCKKLLANPIMESYQFELRQA